METETTVRRMITFAVGGPLRGFYMDMEVRPEENDSGDSAELVIRRWAVQHFPCDWAGSYEPAEFEPQIDRFGLKLLAKGRIEHYAGEMYFHEEVDANG